MSIQDVNGILPLSPVNAETNQLSVGDRKIIPAIQPGITPINKEVPVGESGGSGNGSDSSSSTSSSGTDNSITD